MLKGPISAVLLAVVSGALWGVFAVLTKGVVDRLDDGVSHFCARRSCTRGRLSPSQAPRGSSSPSGRAR